MEELDKRTFELAIKKLLERFDKTDEKIRKFAQQTALEEIRLLDNQDICTMLHINIRTLHRYRKAKLIPSFDIGGKNYYRVVDVQKFIAERT